MSNESRRDLLERLIVLIRSSQNDTDVFDDAAAEFLGISRTDARCLDVLDREGPITAGRLAELARLSGGAITSVLDRLEALGYARRTRDTKDRRRVLVEVTPAFRRAAAEIYGEADPASGDLFPQYGEKELELLVDFFERGREFSAQRLANLERLRRERA